MTDRHKLEVLKIAVRHDDLEFKLELKDEMSLKEALKMMIRELNKLNTRVSNLEHFLIKELYED